MRNLLVILGVGVLLIAIYVGWNESRRSDRRSRLEDRAGRLERDTAQAGARLDSAKTKTDSVGTILVRDLPRARTILKEVLVRDTLTDTVWLTRPQVEEIKRTVGTCEVLKLACAEERAAAQTRAAKADSLAKTYRNLYVNEKRRRLFSRGTQVGAGYCLRPDLTSGPCGYVGYGVSVGWP